jgi:hypothetical protein
MTKPAYHKREEGRGKSLQDYWPLIALISVAALAATCLALGFASLTLHHWMHGFMGIFLVIFALLKLFDLPGFKDGFAMYDLLARKVRSYGYVYPFLELGLGLAYLAFFMPVLTYSLTIVLFAFGTLGVIFALRRGLDIDCPCMGNILSVPLSTVTLTEDLAMVVMAGVMLFTTL